MTPKFVQHSSESPVTVYYNGRGVTPTRGIVYRKIRKAPKGFDPTMYGKITYCGLVLLVARQLDSLGNPSAAWESCGVIPRKSRKATK